ncbi:MAG: hypothetical protein JWN44_2886 [Myxococcales bacterium]|nr:hypothetical protein [Myxococcales bacterium]
MMDGASAMPKRKGPARVEEVAALKAAMGEILRQASRRFEGQSCPRCLAIESLATEALRSTEHDETSRISLPQLNALLDRKRK